MDTVSLYFKECLGLKSEPGDQQLVERKVRKLQNNADRLNREPPSEQLNTEILNNFFTEKLPESDNPVYANPGHANPGPTPVVSIAQDEEAGFADGLFNWFGWGAAAQSLIADKNSVANTGVSTRKKPATLKELTAPSPARADNALNSLLSTLAQDNYQATNNRPKTPYQEPYFEVSSGLDHDMHDTDTSKPNTVSRQTESLATFGMLDTVLLEELANADTTF